MCLSEEGDYSAEQWRVEKVRSDYNLLHNPVITSLNHHHTLKPLIGSLKKDVPKPDLINPSPFQTLYRIQMGLC